MKRIVRTGITITVMLSIICITACSKENDVKTPSDNQAGEEIMLETQAPTAQLDDADLSGEPTSLMDEAVTREVAGWTFCIENCMIGKKLHNVNVILGYSDVETKEVNYEATEGKEYCLLKCSFTKGKTTEVIDWTKLALKDSTGNESFRVSDSFIEDLGLIRMKGTKLNFGRNEGWIAFEIKEGERQLTLSYDFTDMKYEEQLPIK